MNETVPSHLCEPLVAVSRTHARTNPKAEGLGTALTPVTAEFGDPGFAGDLDPQLA
jgi:hypothetical protein